MCFSATASFAAGGALVAAGGLTIAQTKKKYQLPFACIPLLFGIQQITEGIIWISFGSPLLNIMMTYTYSIFSQVLWPIFIPLSVLLLEKDHVRKKILYLFFAVGLTMGLYLLYFIIKDPPIIAYIANRSIAYSYPHIYSLWIIAFYVVITCGSAVVSSYKMINAFGILLFISFFIASYFFNETLFSVWCFFAALLSFPVYFHLKHVKPK